METYPFSKVSPPNVLPAIQPVVPPPESDIESAGPSLPHIGRLSAFFIIGLVGIPALAIAALLTQGRAPGSGLNSLASTESPIFEAGTGTDEIEAISPSTTARMVVAGTPYESPAPADIFAAPTEDFDSDLIAPSQRFDTPDRVAQGGTETIERTVVTASEVHDPSGQTTPAEIIGQDALLAAMTLESTETVVGVDGEQVIIASLKNESEQTRSLVAIHQSEAGYAVAYLLASFEAYSEALERYQEDVVSVRHAG